MLDAALPTFFLKPSTEKAKHKESFYFTQHGSNPEAVYALTSVDPAATAAKNTYAIALFDSYNPDVLYGEVLSKPGWTQPTLSQEEIRKNGGVPPPPQPIFPTEFAVQLYNPEQQVIVKQQTTKWSNTASYEFSMPQTTFRTPSASSLDRSQNDPGVDASTPQVNFVWRKEGRRDLTCYLTGKSTDPTGRKAKKGKEPDIAVALFSGLKEMTIMEPNLYRVEIEDYKGLEVVLLLSGATIRDLFFSNQKESYHIIDQYTRKNSGGLRGRKGSSPLEAPNVVQPVMTPQPPPRQHQAPAPRPVTPAKGTAAISYNNLRSSRNHAKRTSLPPLRTGSQPTQHLDPRSQWEIDAETARLKAQVETEAREQRRQKELARQRREEEEERKTRQFLQEEERKRHQAEKDRRRRQAEVDQETERLRRQFGNQSNLLPPARPQQRPPQPAQPRRPQGPYLYQQGPQSAASHSTFFSNGLLNPNNALKTKKKSFWGLRSRSEGNSSTLKKKQSSMF